MSNILTVQSFYNPFFVDDRQIKKIHFYNESGVIFSTRSGWFGNNNKYKNGLEVPEILSKRKIDFNLKKCFFVPVAGEFYEKGKFCELYLFVDGEKIKIIDRNETSEKMTDSDLWIYDNITFKILNETITENLVKKIIRTDFGKKVDSISAELEGAGIKIDSYMLTKLLKSYDLIKKA